MAFFVAAAPALVVPGRLSNCLGRRRPVALAAIGSAALSCVVLMGSHGALGLSIGRLLQGLACDLTPSALGSYVIDSASPASRRPAAAPGAESAVSISL